MSKNKQNIKSELEDLRRENLVLKSLISSMPKHSGSIDFENDAELIEFIEKQKLFIHINDYAQKLTSISSSDDIFHEIATQMKQITKVLAVTVSLYDKSTKDMVIRSVSASENSKGLFEKAVGKRLEGSRMPISDDLYQSLIDNPTLETDSLQEFSFGSIPHSLSIIASKLLSINWMVGLVLIHQGEIIGTMGLVGSSGSVNYRAEDLQGFQSITTIAIHRWLTDTARLKDEQIYSMIAENTTDAIWTMDFNMKLTFVSSATKKIRGFTADELITMDFRDIFTPESYRKTASRFAEEMKIEQAGTEDPNRYILLELEQYHKDGGTIWVETKVSFLRDQHLKAIGILGISRDITARKKAESELSFKNSVINSLIFNLPFDFWVRDLNSKLILINEQSKNLWNYKLGDSPPDTPDLSPEMLDKWYQNNQLVLSGQTIREELLYDDRTFFQVISPIYENGKITAFGGINIDISETKLLEKKIRQSEQNLAVTLNSIGDAVISTDSKGKITMMNPVAELMTGYTFEIVKGRPLEEIFNIIDFVTLEPSPNPVIKVLSEGKVVGLTSQTVLIAKDGTERHISDSAAPIIDADGKIIGVVLVFSDVSNEYQARINLRKSEAKLSKAEIIAGFGNIEMDLETKEIWASKGARLIYGFDEDSKLTQSDTFGQTLPRYRPILIEAIEKATKSQSSVDVDFLIRNKADGQVRHLTKNITYYPKTNSIYGVLQDVTSIKTAQIELEYSETRYKQIVEKLNSAVIIEQFGKIVFSNKAALNMFKTDNPELLIGKRLSEFVHQDDKNSVTQLLQTMEYTNLSDIAQNVYVEKRFVSFTDSLIIGEIRLVSVDYRGKSATMVLLTDVSTRKLAESALVESELKFRSLAENIQDIIIRFNTDCKIIYINSVGLEFFNLDEKDVLGKTQSELNLFSTEESTYWEMQLKDALQYGNAHRLQIEVGGKDQFSYLDWFITPEFDANHRIASVMCISRDITEMRLIQIELEKAKVRAEEADLLKSTFLANMSHEIRTPMNGIIGFSGMLAQEDLSLEDRLEYATILNNSSLRLMGLIDNILDLSKLEANQIETSMSFVNINRLVNDNFKLFKKDAARKALQFVHSCDLPNDQANLVSDAGKINKILRLLISNAIKFTPSGKIEFGYRAEAGKIIFFVEDTGIGISDSFMDKIFSRFSQEDSSFNRNYEGSGLGLCIAKGFAELIGSNLEVQSEKGVGSRFHFSIDQTKTFQKQEDNIINQKSENKVPSTGKKIIIAEDDNISFLLLSSLLRKVSDCEILHANNGQEAVELVGERSDLLCIFMDIKMPVMDGISATRIIRQKLPELAIIAVTALAMMGDSEQAISAGCSEYITKPFNSREIVALLKKYS